MTYLYEIYQVRLFHYYFPALNQFVIGYYRIYVCAVTKPTGRNHHTVTAIVQPQTIGHAPSHIGYHNQRTGLYLIVEFNGKRRSLR